MVNTNVGTAPLYDSDGNLAFFLGGQINCSTTIHSRADVVKILSFNDDDYPDVAASQLTRPSAVPSSATQTSSLARKSRSSFFKSGRVAPSADGHQSVRSTTPGPQHPKAIVKGEAGMEGELLRQVGQMALTTQVEAFYTAYSKVCQTDMDGVV